MQAAVVRLIGLALVLFNQALVTMGYNPLPFSEEQMFEAVSVVATVVVSIYVWYKNNDVTEEAKAGTEYTHQLKAERKTSQ